MHKQNLVVMAVLVLALGALAWWSLEREQGDPAPQGPRVLLPDVAREDVVAVRLDQLQRSVQMRAERRADGWWIVDPIEFPFEASLVAPMLDALLATPSQASDEGVEGKGFEPPRAVLTVEVQGPSGTQQRRVELGATDVDATHVFARVDGRLMRTLRNLETLLDRPLADWRSRALVSLAPMSVVSLTRSGEVALPGTRETLDLTLALELGERWRTSAPFTAQLAPERVGPLLTSLCYLRLQGFEDDTPGPLAVYGLDPPDVRVELATAQGERIALRFAFVPGREALRVMREDWPQVFTVAREMIAPLFVTADEMVDRELLRVPRERLQAFGVRRAGGSVRFERHNFGWTVSSEGASSLQREPADDAAVDALVAALEAARVEELLPGVEHAFEEGDCHVTFEVDGDLLGWTVGGPIEGARGTRGRAFRRDGDTLLGLVGDELVERLSFAPEDYVSRELHRVREFELVQARVAAPWAEVRRQWSRDPQGRWSPEGSTAEARDLLPLLDALLNQRALRRADAAEAAGGLRGIEVALLDASGAAKAAFTLSLPPGADFAAPREVWYRAGSRAAVVDGALYAGLAKLLGL